MSEIKVKVQLTQPELELITRWMLHTRWIHAFKLSLVHHTPSLRRSVATSEIPPLIGTAPQHKRHLIISTPVPAKDWPSRLETVSPLAAELNLRWPSKAIQGLGHSFAEATHTHEPSTEGQSWQPTSGEEESVVSLENERTTTE